MHAWWYVVYSTFIALGLVATGFAWSYYVYRVDQRRAKESADRFLETARREADLIRHTAEAHVTVQVAEERQRLETANARQRDEWLKLTHDLLARQANAEERARSLDERESALETRRQSKEKAQQTLATLLSEAEALVAARRQALSTAAALPPEKAREEALAEARREAEAEAAACLRSLLDDARLRVREEARRLTVLAIEKNAASVVGDVTTASVTLPTEDMKGRLIGKDGRNIKAFETTTGVNLLVDETPGQAILSACDPVRREIARLALVRLVADGRIHPGRIEEAASQARQEVEDSMQKAGEDAVAKLGLKAVAPELVTMVGRLALRTSNTQNVLAHSVEMAGILATLTGELGLDIDVAKRIGLFHDLGKAFTHEREGSHALLGAELLKSHGESATVVNAVAAHHAEVPPESLYAHLCVAADAITAARPGARQENTAQYLRRIESLEALANSMPGVQSSFAIYAGREIRVLVDPAKISDDQALGLARDLSRKIRDTVQHAGPVRVTVVRETRAVEFAR